MIAKPYPVTSHTSGVKGDGVQLALVFGGVVLLLIAAAATVVYEDQREARRRDRLRREYLVRLGELEPPPVAPSRIQLPGLRRSSS